MPPALRSHHHTNQAPPRPTLGRFSPRAHSLMRRPESAFARGYRLRQWPGHHRFGERSGNRQSHGGHDCLRRPARGVARRAPGGGRLPRLAGVRCCAGVVALVLGIGWAVRADAGRSVPPPGVSPEGTVPLSEHERRQLEQIEAALRAGDPRFAGAVRAADPRVHYRRRVVAAAVGFLVGVGLLLAGVVVNVIVIAVAGFVVMLACTLWAVTSYRRMTGSATGRAPAKDGWGNKRRAAR